MNHDPASLDAFARHLATLLSTVDLAAQLSPRAERPGPDDLLLLARAASGASRISLFRVRGASGDSDEPLSVVRLGRVDGEGLDSRALDFQNASIALLLSCLGTGASEAVGPLGTDEPLRAAHREIEPDRSRFAVFVPASWEGEPLGVLEATRDDRPFDSQEIALLEAAARTAVTSVFLADREDTVAALLVSLLDPAVRATPLRARVRAFLEERRMGQKERQALIVAAGIADLSRHSSRALTLADDVLRAIARGLSSDGHESDREEGKSS
jgi:GAF domain-containing protein